MMKKKQKKTLSLLKIHLFFIQTIGSMKPEDIVMNAFKKLLEKISSVQMGLTTNDANQINREPPREF